MKDRIPQDKKRGQDVVRRCLVNNETLQTIGNSYGISRERVRQIFFGMTGSSAPEIKMKLEAESTKFRCLNCGKSLTDYQRRNYQKYCNRGCKYNANRWNLEVISKCDYCGILFHPYRDFRQFHSDHTYCCRDHYVLDVKDKIRLKGQK